MRFMEQFLFFCQDINKMAGKKKIRILYIWLTRAFVGIFVYRLERSLFLLFGSVYKIIRILGVPLINLLQAYSNLDIHYEADIKGGLSVLHPSMGVVVSGRAKLGKNCTFIGGNVIGIRNNSKEAFILGDHLHMGANATIIGPLILGNNVTVGASACVTKSYSSSDITLVGVPAKILNKQIKN